MCKKEFFQSSGTKTELYAKFRNENNSLPYKKCQKPIYRHYLYKQKVTNKKLIIAFL